MTRIGITGGIGSGKTYVCQLLKQHGIPVYHCDDEAKRLMVESATIREQLRQLIGNDTYINNTELLNAQLSATSCQLNKPLIAAFLFANEDNAAKLNAIVHPVVKEDFLQWAEQQNTPIVVQECALLFESGFQDTVDVTVEVYAPLSMRLERATKRDHATPEQIEARMAQQMNEEEKRLRADFCILNDGTTDLEKQIEHLLIQIERFPNKKKS